MACFVLIFEFSMPYKLQAHEIENSIKLGPTFVQVLASDAEKQSLNFLLEVENKKPKYIRWVTVTAYSSTVDQCDDSPFITANGKWVYDGLAATNFLYFGTHIKFPDYFGNKIFTVDDRMNKKYNSRIDIWMPTRQQAKEFGVKYLKVEVY